MEALWCHFVGDYVLQNHLMATEKVKSWGWACIHAFFYSLPFLVVFPSISFLQWLILAGTHAVIDHYRLAKYWCEFWGVGHAGIWWSKRNGEFQAPPPFLGVWLLIIVDNVMHVTINALVLYPEVWHKLF